MVALQIRGVPVEVRDALSRRAQMTGQSLQGYLLSLVTRDAAFTRNIEVVERLREQMLGVDVTAEQALEVLDRTRTERDQA
ncbi:MAG: hypothetical protein Q4G45_08060 [Actinomycetia bacterium]|nr:hypothetical protein [Actinomycetes bacterium]